MNPFRHTDDNAPLAALRKPQPTLVVLFSAFVFAQLVILRMANRAGSGFLPKPQQELVYGFIQIVVICGFFAHTTAHSLLSGRAAYRGLTASVLSLCTAGALTMLFAPCASLFYLIVTGLTVLSLGFIGGAVYVLLAEIAVNRKHAGLLIGSGYATAVALQYVLQLQWEIKPVLTALLVISFAALGFLLLSGIHFAPEPARETKPLSRAVLIFSLVITLALLMFTSYYNSYIHHLQIASGYTDYNVYSLPRLLMIPTAVLFGFIGDIREGRLLPLCTLCVVSLALLNTALLGRETYLLNMCLYYVALTSVVLYYHLTFLHLAPRTKHPALWASMGRVLDSAVVILSFLFQFSKLSQVGALIVDISALAVVLVMMALSGAFNLSVPRREEAAAVSPAVDPFTAIQNEFRLTPSEIKVLRELVQTDDKQETIASGLNISVSTLRHHVTSIYKKTGVQTRAALCKLAQSRRQ